MSLKNQKQNPKYIQGRPCKKCGNTLKLQSKRKRPDNGKIYYTSSILDPATHLTSCNSSLVLFRSASKKNIKGKKFFSIVINKVYL